MRWWLLVGRGPGVGKVEEGRGGKEEGVFLKEIYFTRVKIKGNTFVDNYIVFNFFLDVFPFISHPYKPSPVQCSGGKALLQ